MDKTIRVVYEDDIEPTIFKNRETKRLITLEREQSEHMSFHVCTAFQLGLSPVISYPSNDEILYFLEDGESRIIWEDNCVQLRKGSAVYIPAGCKYQIHSTRVHKTVVVIAPPRLREEWAGRPDLMRLERA